MPSDGNAGNDIVGFGIATTDHLGIIDRYPEEDTKQRLAGYEQQGGGTVATPLVACARLGLRTAYLGRLGVDPASDFIETDFRREGVDTAHAIRNPEFAPPVAMILVNPQARTRTIVWHKPGVESVRVEQLDEAAIRSSRMLYLDAHEPEASLAAALWIRDAGGLVMVDADNMNEGIEPVLSRAHLIIGSMQFSRAFSGHDDPERGAHALFERFGGICGITAGECGSWFVAAAGTFHQPAFPVDVLDTTGAGDVFHGAFAVGVLRGWPMQDAACFAAAVAAMKCRRLGGRAGIPTFPEAVAFLRERGRYGAWDR